MARFSNALAICLCVFIVGGGVGQPSDARTEPEPRLLPLQAVKAVAAREGLVITSVYAEAPRRLIVLCAGPMDKALFLKRASLVSFAAFQSWAAPVEVVFEHTHLGVTQRCRVRQADLEAYLKERISRQEYDRRLVYQRDRAGQELPPPPPLPVVAATPSESPSPSISASSPAPQRTYSPPAVSGAPRVSAPPASAVPSGAPRVPAPPASAVPSAAPRVPSPPAATPLSAAPSAIPPDTRATAVPTPNFFATPPPVTPEPPAVLRPGADFPRQAPGEWRAAYVLGLGGSYFDALSLEHSRSLLPTLDIRPNIWMVGGLAPRTLLSRNPSSIDGVSLALDLMGTGHRMARAGEVSFEGGVGIRASVLQGATSGLWPATHLRVGARWRSLSLGMRYPLLARPGDPTALWDVGLGYHWSTPGAGVR